MYNTTLQFLRCPGPQSGPRKKSQKARALCGARLELHAGGKPRAVRERARKCEDEDVRSGHLQCVSCDRRYPILAGVAVLVEDVRGYLLEHVKGIAQVVPDSELPREFAAELRAARKELQAGHIEDDLEAERVISLYLMNHFLHASGGDSWWKPREGSASPLIDSLVRAHWDQGPLNQIAAMVEKAAKSLGRPLKTLELGCGVGGLALKAGAHARPYLGVDSSFAAIALGRHLVLGAPYSGKIRIPEDLLQGPVSRELKLAPTQPPGAGSVDFVVGELEAAPVARGEWDLGVALNTIDMLEEPSSLPLLTRELLRPGGLAIQSCPYIWHEAIAARLRARLPKTVKDSAAAAEWLYTQAGFEIQARQEHVPWLFYKHVRQLEIYSVHLFQARVSL